MQAESFHSWRSRVIGRYERAVGIPLVGRARWRSTAMVQRLDAIAARLEAANEQVLDLSKAEASAPSAIAPIFLGGGYLVGPFAPEKLEEEDEDEGWAKGPSRQVVRDMLGGRLVNVRAIMQWSMERDDGAGWTEWQTIQGENPYMSFDAKGDPEWGRFYALWAKLSMEEYGTQGLRFLFLDPLSEVYGDADVADGGTNCALLVLRERFPKSRRELMQIELTDEGRFGPDQGAQAVKILKRNVEMRDRTGGLMWKAGAYKTDRSHTVVLYNIDGHAEAQPAVLPKLDGVEVEMVEDASLDVFSLKRRYGRLAKVWEMGGNCAVVEALDDNGAPTVRVVRTRCSYEAIAKRAEELEVDRCELMQSPFGVEVRKWREMHGFEDTPEALEGLWFAANLFPTAYCTGTKPGATADLNSAYESSPMNGAKDLFDHYGFPDAGGMIILRDPAIEVLQETGLVVAILDLERCHPWVRRQVGSERSVLTTMRLKVWVDCGAASIRRLELAVVARRYFPTLQRPEGAQWACPTKDYPDGRVLEEQRRRHWGRGAIGRLIPSNGSTMSMRWMCVLDNKEASSILATLSESGELGHYSYVPGRAARPEGPEAEEDWEAVLADWEAVLADLEESPAKVSGPAPVEAEQEEPNPIPGYHRFAQRVQKRPRGCFHAHAYYIDYTAAVIDREVFRHDWSKIVKVATDSITLAEGEAFSGAVEFGGRPGQWKAEAFKKIQSFEAPERPVPEFPAGGRYWDVLARSGEALTVFEGPPGYGKTHHCLANLDGHRFVALTPTRKMRRKLAARGIKAYTWQWALKPGRKFEPAAVRIAKGSLLYIGEIGTWHKETAMEILGWLIEHHKCRIIADGDRKQMPPYKGEAAWGWLESREDTTIEWFEQKDWRSKDEKTIEIKRSLRGLSNREAIRLVSVESECVDSNSFLEAWHPHDYVYTVTNEMRETVLHPAMQKLHREKYPEISVRIRYGENSKDKSGEEEYMPLGKPLPSHASLAYTSTYSSCQGETAEPIEGRSPRVWLVDHHLGGLFENAVYVGATRVETAAQLGVVEGLLLGVEQRRVEYEYGIDDEIYGDCL